MANRPIFIPTITDKELFKEESIEFKFYNGFSVTQKAKSIDSLHQSAKKLGFTNILEVSTKSSSKLGYKLSAFNLKLHTKHYGDISIESAFQGSKIFEDAGPFYDIYKQDPLSAKRDRRLKQSGDLKAFSFEDITWELEPKSAFYDWIYIKALYQNIKQIQDELLAYDAFTDIEFNPKKSINCQARACAILVSLIKKKQLEEAMKSPDSFKTIVYKKLKKQLLFEF